MGQQKPAADRITEIEAALVKHGVLAGEPDGVWDDASKEALKRFQESHHIAATGRITSLSLIALGLGPQRQPMVNAALPGTVNSAPAVASGDGDGSPRD
ncbi:MAG: peptidoglycan-binding domain-containing protein [Bryobacteraceae bacterium]